jgi:hypothetical protein
MMTLALGSASERETVAFGPCSSAFNSRLKVQARPSGRADRSYLCGLRVRGLCYVNCSVNGWPDFRLNSRSTRMKFSSPRRQAEGIFTKLEISRQLMSVFVAYTSLFKAGKEERVDALLHEFPELRDSF